MQQLCRVAKRHLPASGVGVSLFDEDGGPMPAAASSPSCALLEELQLTLGEGPCLAAYAAGRPVLVPDLTEASSTWPAYSSAVSEHGVRAVFAFPMQVGAARLGAMDVYRSDPSRLSPAELSRAVSFAEVGTGALLHAQSHGGDPARWLDDLEMGDYRIFQAQGMVTVQLGVSMHEAMLRLRAYAYAHDRRLKDVSEDIVRRRLTLSSDEDAGGP